MNFTMNTHKLRKKTEEAFLFSKSNFIRQDERDRGKDNSKKKQSKNKCNG